MQISELLPTQDTKDDLNDLKLKSLLSEKRPP